MLLTVVEGGRVFDGAEAGEIVAVGVELRELAEVDLPTRLALAVLSLDSDARTLNTELVAVKPVVILGTVGASDMV